MNEQQEILDEIQKLLPVHVPGFLSRETILQELTLAVSALLQQNADSFFQLMYRLDISERRLKEALEDKVHAVDKLAVLIYERQVQKIRTRRQSPDRGVQDKDLEW